MECLTDLNFYFTKASWFWIHCHTSSRGFSKPARAATTASANPPIWRYKSAKKLCFSLERQRCSDYSKRSPAKVQSALHRHWREFDQLVSCATLAIELLMYLPISPNLFSDRSKKRKSIYRFGRIHFGLCEAFELFSLNFHGFSNHRMDHIAFNRWRALWTAAMRVATLLVSFLALAGEHRNFFILKNTLSIHALQAIRR